MSNFFRRTFLFRKHLRFVCISMGQRKEMRSGTKNVWKIEISLLIFCCVFFKKIKISTCYMRNVLRRSLFSSRLR